jgi:hypothetical protein
MADGTRFKTIETQLSQLTEMVNNQMRQQLETLTNTVAAHSSSIATTASTLAHMEAVLHSMAQNTVTHGNHNHRDQSFHVRNVRLEFPRFDGTDALAWIFKADQFFDYYNTPDPERLTIAAVHMDHKVIPWF